MTDKNKNRWIKYLEQDPKKVVTEKKCILCCEIIPTILFTFSKKSNDGLGSYCLQCKTEHERERIESTKKAQEILKEKNNYDDYIYSEKETKKIFEDIELENLKTISKNTNSLFFTFSLNDLRDRIHKNALNKGFYEHEFNFSEKLMLIVSELVEAQDDFRNGLNYNHIYFEDEKPCGIPTELADALIRILDLCGYLEIDIDKVVEQKMQYNYTRPHKHGKVI